MISIVRLALLAMLVATPAFAKNGHPSHARSPHGSANAVARKSAARVHGQEAVSPDAPATGSVEPVSEPAPVSAKAKTHDISMLPKVPVKNETRRIIPPAASPGRNAIGLTVAPSHPAPSMSGGEHPKMPAVVSGPPKAVSPMSTPHPIVSASIGNPGKIGGTSVLRPAASPATPAGLGGPAKTASGINGTTIRSKHY